MTLSAIHKSLQHQAAGHGHHQGHGAAALLFPHYSLPPLNPEFRITQGTRLPGPNETLTLWEAVRSSTAAPTYFRAYHAKIPKPTIPLRPTR